jgi:hypothetical protein
MRKLVIKSIPTSLIRMKDRNKLGASEKKVMELIITISKKKVAMKTSSAHKKLLKLGKKISEKPEWKKIRGREVEEFLKYRERV